MELRRLDKEMREKSELIGRHQVHIHDLSQKTSIPAEFQLFKAKVEMFMQQNDDKINTAVAQIGMVKGVIDQLQQQINQLKTLISALDDKISVGLSSFQNHISNEDMKSKAEHHAISDKFLDIENKFQKKLDDLKASIVVSPKDILETNTTLVKKMEAAQLDANNALLKLGNLELITRIIDKKADNLDIRIKKLELER